MKIKLLSLDVENFKGIRKRRVDFGDSTKISGANATGKTSVFDAFTWLLFNKDSLGSEKFNVRPLDRDGNKVHNVEIKVVAVLDVDGREVELSKTQKEKWVKKRGTSTPELQGNENLFEVDGYPKSEKEYRSYIADLLSEDLFKILTNPQYFPALPWKDQRAILMRFASDMPDSELAAELGGFEDLIIELEKAPSTDDIQKKYSKALSEWKKKQAEIPVRIDELEKSKVDMDVAELELAKRALEKQLSTVQSQKSEIDKLVESAREKSKDIMELKFKLSELQLDANAEIDRQRRKMTNDLSMLSSEAVNLNNEMSSKMRALQIAERDRKLLYEQIQKEGERFKETQGLIFDDSTAVCAYCGQEYPSEKKERIKADFEAQKQAKLQEISDRGCELTTEYKALSEQIKKCKLDIYNLESSLKVKTSSIESLKKVLVEMPDGVDISDREDVLALKKQIADAEQAMVDEQLKTQEGEDFVFEIQLLQKEIWAVDANIAKAKNNVAIEERIAELQAEQRAVAQKVADQEKMIYLLEQFIRAKMESISSGINTKFDGISWKLFDMQLNGGMKECCECTVNGVPYGSLNNGHRIIAGLAIIKALQNLYGAYLPIWVDNAESINDFNIPQMENQMILLAVSDNEELTLEV